MSSNIDVRDILPMLQGAHRVPSLASRLLAPLTLLADHWFISFVVCFLFYTFCGEQKRSFLRSFCSNLFNKMVDLYGRIMTEIFGYDRYYKYLDELDRNNNNYNDYVYSKRGQEFAKAHPHHFEKRKMHLLHPKDYDYHYKPDDINNYGPYSSTCSDTSYSENATEQIVNRSAPELNFNENYVDMVNNENGIPEFILYKNVGRGIYKKEKTYMNVQTPVKVYNVSSNGPQEYVAPEKERVVPIDEQVRGKRSSTYNPSSTDSSYCYEEYSEPDAGHVQGETPIGNGKKKLHDDSSSWDYIEFDHHIFYSKEKPTGKKTIVIEKYNNDAPLEIEDKIADTLPLNMHLANALRTVKTAFHNGTHHANNALVSAKNKAVQFNEIIINKMPHNKDELRDKILEFRDGEEESNHIVEEVVEDSIEELNQATYAIEDFREREILSNVHPALHTPLIARATDNEKVRSPIVEKVVDNEMNQASTLQAFNRHFRQDFHTRLLIWLTSLVNGLKNYGHCVSGVVNILKQYVSAVKITAKYQIIRFGTTLHSVLSWFYPSNILTQMLRLPLFLVSLMTRCLVSIISLIFSQEPKNLAIICLLSYVSWNWKIKYLIVELYVKHILKNRMLSIALLEWTTLRGAVARQLLLKSLTRLLVAQLKNKL